MIRVQARESSDGARGAERTSTPGDRPPRGAAGPIRSRVPDEAEPRGANRGLRVLLVEDSQAVVDRVVEMLASELPIDYVEAVDSEPEALATEGPWDAAIVDLSLREGNGFSVLRALQRRGEPRPFVVVLTDFGRPEFRALAATFGAREFLQKSTDFDRLPDVLRPVAAACLAAGVRH